MWQPSLSAEELTTFIVGLRPSAPLASRVRASIVRHAPYSLERISLKIIWGAYELDEARVREYMSMDVASMPPIVVEVDPVAFTGWEYGLVDGAHRREALCRLGADTVLAYVGRRTR